jgi:hypothetical protein
MSRFPLTVAMQMRLLICVSLDKTLQIQSTSFQHDILSLVEYVRGIDVGASLLSTCYSDI